MIKDTVNLIVVLSVILWISRKYKLQWWENSLIFLHLIVLFFINHYLPVSYLPDQIGYFNASKEWRDLHSCTHPFFTICSTGFIFALFPLFIESYTSIALINFIIYLLLLMFVLKIYEKHPFHNYIRLFVLLYPSLIFNSSLGLRDMLIVIFMISSIYYYVFADKRVMGLGLICPLILLKPQNFAILLAAFLIYESMNLRLNNKKLRVTFLLFVSFVFMLLVFKYYPMLYAARNRMYAESYHLNPYIFDLTFPDWTLLELYRFFLAPLPWQAKNIQQQIQGWETLGLLMVLSWLLYKLKDYKLNCVRLFVLVFILLIAAILYSYAVFNWGAITRYRFPFYLCWFLLLPLCIKPNKVS